MKLLKLTIALLFFSALQLNAQVELKINPIGLLFGGPDLSADIALNHDNSLEPFIGFYNNSNILGTDWDYHSIQGGLSYKYYFNPNEKGTDRFYVGAYTRYRHANLEQRTDSTSYSAMTDKMALGLLIGQKWVSRKNVVFELELGVGRKFFNNIHASDGADTADISGIFNTDVLFRFALGYRFGGNK